MSLEIELREVACAQQGCTEQIKEIRRPARNKYQARVLLVRGRILLWLLHPVSQQCGHISLFLLRDENTIRIQRFAPKSNSSAIPQEPDGFRIPAPNSLARKKPDLTLVRPGQRSSSLG